jgi:hypothetical protein
MLSSAYSFGECRANSISLPLAMPESSSASKCPIEYVPPQAGASAKCCRVCTVARWKARTRAKAANAHASLEPAAPATADLWPAAPLFGKQIKSS